MIKKSDFKHLFDELDKRLLPLSAEKTVWEDTVIPSVDYEIITPNNSKLRISVNNYNKNIRAKHFYAIATIEKYQFEILPLDVQLHITTEGLHYNRHCGKLMFFAASAQDLYSQIMRYTKGYFDFEI